MSNRILIAIPLLACALCNHVVAQEHSKAVDEQPSVLHQAKAVGAKKSKYLRSQTLTESEFSPTENAELRLKTFHDEIRPLLQKACVDCHGEETMEGNLRIDTLSPDLTTGNDVSWWVEVQAVLANGEMPPPDTTELKESERTRLVEWLSNEIQIASTVRRSTLGSSSFRRLTRYEYNYALQDLLGLPLNFAKDLPPEPHSGDGFQNSSEMLHMSVAQLETYRQLARKALRKAIKQGERPLAIQWQITMKEAADREFAEQEKQLNEVRSKFKDDPEALEREVGKLRSSFQKAHRRTFYRSLTTGRTAEAQWNYRGARYAFAPGKTIGQVPPSFDHVAVIPSGRNQYLNVELGDQIPDEGVMRVKVRASRTSADTNHIPSLQLHFGFQASNEGKAVVRVSDQDTPIAAKADAPEIYQWDVRLSEIYPRNSFKGSSRMGGMPSPSEYIRFVNSSVPQGKHGEIQIDYVEVTAPVYDEWPPSSHQQIFFRAVDSNDESSAAKAVLSRFLTKAFRRQPLAGEVERKLYLFAAVRPECDSFEDAMLEVLATILSSPNFLYVVNDSSPVKNDSGTKADRSVISDTELATRLSLFLWSSVPDDELLKLAATDQLSSPDTLTAQVDRMLADSRSERLANHFVHQWLDLQLLDFMQTRRGTDPALKESMQREPIEYFQHVLRNDASVLDFLHSDYVVVDEQLAHHYGLTDVRGNQFRPVLLSGDHRRGGLLTQSGLLAMNSDGKDSHPLKRGVWLLKSILNDPPPPPPPAVPEIDLADPEIAKMTLKERIEDHRNHPACLSCHSKIDPWGIAFENYDALGRYRETVNGQPVDASSLLFNRQELDGMRGLKQFLLLNRQDQFVRSMVYKLATYSLGRPLTFSDHAEVDEISARVRQKGDGLATMIHQLVASNLFRSL